MRLNMVYDFIRKGDYAICTNPKRYIRDLPLIKLELTRSGDCCLPLIYDIVGWEAYLPECGTKEEMAKVDAITNYIFNELPCEDPISPKVGFVPRLQRSFHRRPLPPGHQAGEYRHHLHERRSRGTSQLPHPTPQSRKKPAPKLIRKENAFWAQGLVMNATRFGSAHHFLAGLTDANSPPMPWHR